MGLKEQFPRNQRCIERCGKVALCSRMIEKGQDDLERAKTAPGYSTSGPEFETDDGRLVSFEEFIGLPNEKQLLQEAGEALVSSGVNLRRMLLEGCPDGAPIELKDGVTICRSEHGRAVFFTEADLER